MTSVCHSVSLEGLDAARVFVEVDVARGVPSFSIVGLGDTSVQQARERVSAAIRNAGYAVPLTRKTVNLAPSGTRKTGSHYDLAIAVGLLAASGASPAPDEGTVLIGELGLDGKLRPVLGVLPLVLGAVRLGAKRVVVPLDNLREASLARSIEVLGASSLRDVAAWLMGKQRLARGEPGHMAVPAAPEVDLADIRGQDTAKRALELAAVGRHALVLEGSPGSGKTLLAKALRGLLPPLDERESLDATQLHSLAGTLSRDAPMLATASFRQPHHSSTVAALIGGASPPRPGEVSLAHLGLLFLDELPLFTRTALDALLEPLEEGTVQVSRARGSVRYPADVLFVGAMNPCPCGPVRGGCRCTRGEVGRYRARLSGPLLDRVDLHVRVERPSPDDLLGRTLEGRSRAAAQRVMAARAFRVQRGQLVPNARIPLVELHETCRTSPAARRLLIQAADRLQLSARAVHRTLKVARSSADLAASADVQPVHISEALQFRAAGMP